MASRLDSWYDYSTIPKVTIRSKDGHIGKTPEEICCILKETTKFGNEELNKFTDFGKDECIVVNQQFKDCGVLITNYARCITFIEQGIGYMTKVKTYNFCLPIDCIILLNDLANSKRDVNPPYAILMPVPIQMYSYLLQTMKDTLSIRHQIIIDSQQRLVMNMPSKEERQFLVEERERLRLIAKKLAIEKAKFEEEKAKLDAIDLNNI